MQKNTTNKNSKKMNQKKISKRKKGSSTYQRDYPKKTSKVLKSYQVEVINFSPSKKLYPLSMEKSRYQLDFEEKQAMKRNLKPSLPKKRDRSPNGKTTYFEDYPPKKNRLTQSVTLLHHAEKKTKKSKDAEKIDFAEKSTYKHHYPGWSPQPRKKAEKVLKRLQVKFQSETQYQKEFKKKPIPNRVQKIQESNVKNIDKNIKKPKMEAETTFKNDFKPHPLKPRKKVKKKILKNTSKMKKTTNYQDDYPKYEIENLDLIRGKKNIEIDFQENLTLPIEKKSKYQEDYPAHEIKIPKLIQKNEKITKKKGKVREKSSYLEDYKEHDLQALQKNNLGVVTDIPETKTIVNVKMNDKTTFMNDYPWHDPQPSKKIQKIQDINEIKGKMNIVTSYHADFPGHVPEAPDDAIRTFIDDLHGQTKIQSQAKKFDKKTRYQEEYKEHELPKREFGQPITQPKKGKFLGDSTYRKEYKKHQVQVNARVANPKSPARIQKSGINVKMETTTTFMDDYPGHEPNKKQKAKEEYRLVPGKFEGKTSYVEDYPAHEIKKKNNKINIYKELDSKPRPENNLKFSTETTFQADFKPKELQGNQVILQNEKEVLNKAKFQGKSIYQREFPAYEISNEADFQKNDVFVESHPTQNHSRPMENTTTFQRDYQGFSPSQNPQRLSSKEINLGKKKPKIEQKTSYNRDYYEKGIKVVKNRPFEEPQHPANHKGIEFEDATQYQKDYPGYDIQPKQNIDVQEYKGPQGKFYSETTYNKNFIEVPIEKMNPSENPMIKIVEDSLPKKKMDLTTTFNQDYPVHQIKPKHELKKKVYKKPAGRMAKNTSYKQDFIPHEIGFDNNRESEMNEANRGFDQRKKNPKFEGKTSYQEQYQQHKIEKKKPQKNEKKMKKSKFNGSTTYNTEFQKKEKFELQEPSTDPRRIKESHPKNRAKIQGKTTFAMDYPAYESVPIRTRNARSNPPKMKGKMVTVTSYAQDYKKHKLKPQVDAVRTIIDDLYQNVSNNPKFKGSTTFKTDYVPHKVAKRKKNKAEKKKKKPKFKGKTSYAQNYKKHKLPKKNSRKEEKLDSERWKRKNIPKMNDETTFQNDFKPHEIKIKEPVKEDPLEKIGKMNLKTSYNENYIKHKFEKSPRRKIPKNIGDINFKKTFTPPHFRGASHYNETFVPYQLEKGAHFHTFDDRNNSKWKSKKFKGRSTYQKDFLKPKPGGKNVTRTDGIMNQFNSIGALPKKWKMDEETTFQRDFKEKKPSKKMKKKYKIEKKKPKIQGRTSYNMDYEEKAIEQRRRIHEDPLNGEDEVKKLNIKFQEKTENQEKFIPHKIERVRSLEPQLMKKQNKQKFRGETTYKRNFKEKSIIPNEVQSSHKLMKLEPTRVVKEKMDFKTSYNSEFKGKELGNKDPNSKLQTRRDRYKTKKARKIITSYNEDYKYNEQGQTEKKIEISRNEFVSSEPPKKRIKMKFSTSYNSNFVDFEIKSKNQVKRNNETSKKKVPFKGNTTYKTEFEPKLSNLINDHQNITNESKILNLPQRKEKTKFKGRSTYQREYKSIEVKPKRRTKKKTNSNWNKQKMQGKSTYRTEFEVHNLQNFKNSREEKKLYQLNFEGERQKKKANFKGETSYNKDYQELKMEPVKIDTRRNEKKKKPKFRGSSMYQSQFVEPKSSNLNQKASQNIDIFATTFNVRSKPKFEGRTSYQAEFHSHQMPQRKIPKNDDYSDLKAKFNGKTTYNQEFIKKEPKYNRKSRQSMYEGLMSGREMKRSYKTSFKGQTTYQGDFKGV